MSWRSIQLETDKFSQILQQNQVNPEEYATQPRQLRSLAVQIKPLNIWEKQNSLQIQTPTSGESSPCLSDPGKKRRFNEPSVFDMNPFINDFEFSEVDYNIEKLKDREDKEAT